MPALILLTILTVIMLLIAKYDFMIFVFIGFIVLGLSLDVGDFCHRLQKCLKRQNVPSAIPIFGFLFVVVGLVGLVVRSTVTWKVFLILLPLALIIHLAIQMLFPLLFSIICNLYYHRKLFDFSPLPEIKK